MSDPDSPSAEGYNIFYAPDNGNPQDPRGRAFAVTGSVNEAALYAAIGQLRQSDLFQAVHHGMGVIFRIVHKPGYHWSSPLLFPGGQVPASIAVIRERLEQQDDVTMLAYVLSVLCDAMEWDPREVTISELDFG